jgi:maltooligosyltrehalose trehalohydrolase
MMAYRGRERGEPSAGLPPTAFVAFIQNHDQVGNRAFGDRLTMFAPREAVRAIAATYLLTPQIPMIFMGEEWGASQPFPFFCDFGGDLADAVREGRRGEFAKFPEFHDPEQRERIPDPTAAETFISAKLRWNEASEGVHADWRNFYKRILGVRHAEITPRLKGIGGHAARSLVLGDGAVSVTWTLGDGSDLILCANLSATPFDGAPPVPGRRIWVEGEGPEPRLGPWSVIWTLRARDDGKGK